MRQEELIKTTKESVDAWIRTHKTKETEKEVLEEAYYALSQVQKGLRYQIEKDSFTTMDKLKWLKLLSSPVKLFGFPTADHPRALKTGELILEPYEIPEEGMHALIEACWKYCLECKVQGLSSHLPGHTMRIVIKPNKDFPKFEELSRRALQLWKQKQAKADL
ncbi:MAG: hypothetical protein QF811_07095 [Candidatus Woesearchaeota archaeon]|nr:hypothetical protein [Candidatus Woesearchaeota archaeon]